MPVLDSTSIKATAIELGFDLCGVSPAVSHPELTFLREWLDRGYAGTMEYLHRTAERRADVRQVMPAARSVIVVASAYDVDRPYSTEIADPGAALIARYAWGPDYHDVLMRRLAALVEWMRAESDVPIEARPYVDTGPIQERVYAQHAGLGWIGKNTCVIHPARGSWLLLGEILTDLALEPDQPAVDQCGSCTLCIEACPTGALVGPGALDATKCISYLTIELKGAIPIHQRASLGAHVFGCDVCQEVCPWNLAATRPTASEWAPRPALDRARLIDLWQRSDDDLSGLLRESALGRARLRGFRRNLAVSLGNAGIDPRAVTPDDGRPRDSLNDPLVAEHVRWAGAMASGAAKPETVSKG